VSGGDASQNGAPPPPPPPSGSPFGRFLTQPVFLVALVALMISLPIVALAINGGEHTASPPGDEPAVVGSWAGATAGVVGGHVAISLDVRSLDGGDDGTLTRRYEALTCRGTLRHRATTAGGATFDYVERLHPRRCPRRSTVELTPLSDGSLRFREQRRGRLVAEAVLGTTGR
jgi:hypothetical protein